jgi:GGDEF domain-containing protein
VLAEGVAGPAAAAELARRVVAGVREPVTAGGHQLITTCSVGVVVRRTGGRDLPEDVLRDAGLASNLARVKGPNHWELFDQLTREGD